MGSAFSDVAHLLRRAGFGPTRDMLAMAVSAGYEATVNSLLDFSQPDPANALALPQGMSWFPENILAGNADKDPVVMQERQQFMQEQMQSFFGLVPWWLERMRTTAHPLREKLTLNLHNNFATAISKVQLPLLMYNQNQTIRSMCNGNFEELTQALAKDPAMMIWLDTHTDKVQHPNENFARELMERFTMGVGNYTQGDVTAGARGFAGWSINPLDGSYLYLPFQADTGVKTYLGQTGDWTGEDIVHIATNTEASHRWVSSRMWSFLAYPVAPNDPVVVNDLVPVYRENLNVTDLVRAIFLHPQFTSVTAKTGLVKQPVEWLVGMAGSLGMSFTGAATSGSPVPNGAASMGGPMGAPTGSSKVAVGILNQLGQVPMNPPNVGGWPQNQYWLSTASSLTRWRVASQIVRVGDISPVEEASPSDRPDAVAELLGLADGWSSTTAGVLKGTESDPATMTAMALVSPEFVSN